MTGHEHPMTPLEAHAAHLVASRRAGIGAVNPERPSPRSVLLLIMLFVLPVSIIPSSHGGFFRLPMLPRAWWTVYLVLLFGMVALFFRATGYSRRMNRSTLRGFVGPLVLLALWQMVSLLWNGQDGQMRSYSLLQSLCMGAAVLGAALVCSGLSFSSRVRLASGLTFLVGFILLIYMSLSFVFPSLRPSFAWMDRTNAQLGFIRVFGPLGTATTLNFVLLPALGFSFGMTYLRTRSRWLWFLMTLFFVGCVVTTGSRGGLLSLVTFGVLMILWARARAAVLLIPVALALICVFAVVGLPERFQSLQDQARTSTYATGLRAYVSSPRNMLFGAGHGALYSKLHDDSLRKMQGESRWYLLDHRTEYGYSLRNSHSAILRSLVETGIPGLLLTLTPLAWLTLRPFSRSFRASPQPYRILIRSALAGCVAVIPYVMVEEFFISAFWVVVLWTMYAICAAEGMDQPIRA